jgi:predicted phosphodiesterase
MVMKIGILSDLHMSSVRPWDFEPEDDVFYICAGDISEQHFFREEFIRKHADHMFAILGNHDYYGSTFSDAYMHLLTRNVGDIKIAGATLWTDLSKQLDWVYYVNGLIDFRYINDLNQEDMIETHAYHKKFLLTSEADIIVSHHTPSRRSVHERYQGDPVNVCFANDLDKDIFTMRKPPKLWIHGHTHDRFDYMIGDTRVICHPRGYKGEHSDHGSYKPLIVEI